MMHNIEPKYIQRFHDTYTVETSGCWNWQGQISTSGYGRYRYPGGSYAHRFSYTVHIGKIPDGMYVCHSCDNPVCVNPEHLWIGTHNDNMADKKIKNRQNHPHGELNSSAVLTETDVHFIRAARESAGSLAKRYGVSKHAIWHVKSRRTWQHI